MKSYNLNQLINIHNQNVAYLINQAGKNELEKTENYLSINFNIIYTKYKILNKKNQKITCLVYYNKNEENFNIEIFDLNDNKLNADIINDNTILSITECLIDFHYL